MLSEEALIGMGVSESLPRTDLRDKEVTQEKDGEKILAQLSVGPSDQLKENTRAERRTHR